MIRSLVFAIRFSLVALTAVFFTASADLTADFYKAAQERQLLIYECYSTGVTVAPENTVNFTALWDGTYPNNDNAYVITWGAPAGSVDSYDMAFLTVSYDNNTSTLLVKGQGVAEQAMILVEPFNGLAYYFRFSVTSQNNKVVYKLYDVDSGCGNAAALLGNIDQDGQQGFQFVRDVPEPTKRCTKHLLCAP